MKTNPDTPLHCGVCPRRAHGRLAGIAVIGLTVVSFCSGAWEPVGLSGGGAMFSPAISSADPRLMMVNCDMGAAYLSADGGRNWRMINAAELRSDTSCRPAFHPFKPEMVFASSAGQLRISQDTGVTFRALGKLAAPLSGEIAINPRNPAIVLAGARSGRAQISTNSGHAWSLCNGPHGKVLGFHFGGGDNRSRIFIATSEGIWRSDDGGGTWSSKTAGLPAAPVQGFAGGTSSNLTLIYCSVRSDRTPEGNLVGGIFRSTDGGEHWASAMGTGLNKDTAKADQYASGPVAQYIQLLTTDADPRRLYAFNTATGFWPPHHETVFRSDDSGDSWKPVYFQDPRMKQCNVEPGYMEASTGKSWKGGNTPFGVAICNSDPNRILYVMNECHVTHDGGDTWFNGSTRLKAGEKARPGAAWICNGQVVTTTWHYYIDPFESNRHYIAYTDIGFARSLDGGKTWMWWEPGSWAPWRNTCYEMAFDPEVPGRMWGAFSDVHDIPNDNIISERHGHRGPGGVCGSRDFGATWKVEGTGLPARAVTSVVVDPRSGRGTRTLYAGVFDEGVYKSTDDGRTWLVRRQGLGDEQNRRISRVALHRDGTLFAMVCAKRSGRGGALMGGGVGLYRSTNGGDAWTKVNTSLALLYPKDFSVDSSDSRRILIGACDVGGNDKSGGLYLTEDGGATWRRIGREGPQTFGGYFHPQRSTWIYMTLTEGAPRAGLWLSRDSGQSWEAFDQLPFSNVQRVEFDPQNEGSIYTTTFGGSVWHGPSAP